MLRKIVLSALLILCLLPSFAQNALLYKISGKGLQQPSYLYGTIHLICPEDFFISPALKSAVTAAKTVYLEIDMDDPSLMGTMMQAMQAPAGHKLQESFDPSDYSRLAAYMKDSMHTDIQNFQQMKPMVILMTILQRTVSCPTPTSYEVALMQMAAEHKKPIQGLEKIADQIAVFDAIPDSTESRMIMEYINDLPKQKASFARLVAAYKRQDVQALHDLLKEAPEFTGYEDLLVYDRNRNWVPVIEKAMQQETVLIACGAMHLGGAQGLLALLKARGYEVTAIPGK